MFFKSNILNVVRQERRSQNIDDSASSFKLMLLESSIQAKEVKLKNTIDEVVNYFLDNRIYIPKDSVNAIRKREDGVVSSGYILVQLNDLRNKMGKGILTHKDFDVLPNYEGLRDNVKELFKLEIFKKREEERLKKEAEEIEIEKIEKRRVQEILEKMGNARDYRQNYYLSLTNDMHYIKGVRNVDTLITYLMDNKVLIPGDSLEQNNFDSRKLIVLIYGLKSRANLKDSDFNVLPSYDGFREKVKKLLLSSHY